MQIVWLAYSSHLEVLCIYTVWVHSVWVYLYCVSTLCVCKCTYFAWVHLVHVRASVLHDYILIAWMHVFSTAHGMLRYLKLIIFYNYGINWNFGSIVLLGDRRLWKRGTGQSTGRLTMVFCYSQSNMRKWTEDGVSSITLCPAYTMRFTFLVELWDPFQCQYQVLRAISVLTFLLVEFLRAT